MIHRLFTAPLRRMPCLQPHVADAAQRDSYETAATRETRETYATCGTAGRAAPVPVPSRLRAISEGRAFTAGRRTERGLKEAEAAQKRGESIWPWLDALPLPTPRSPHSGRWAALVLRDPSTAPQRLANPERVRQWFEAAWQATGHAPALASWLAERGGGIPVPLTAFAHLHDAAHQPGAQAAMGALFARLPPTQRAALLRDGPQPIGSHELRRAIVGLLPESSHYLVARTWLAHGGCATMIACEVPKLRILNDFLLGYDPVPTDGTEFPELDLVRTPNAEAPGTLPPWTQAVLPPGKPGTGDELAPRERSVKALGRFLFACSAAEVPTATRDAARPLVAALLALPDEVLRRKVLSRLAVALSDPQEAAAALALMAHGPAKALPLRLTAQLFYPDLAEEPGLQAVLQTRSLFAHGPHARSLMQLMADRDHPAYTRQALALTRPNHLRKLVDGPAQAQAIDAALTAAQNAASAGEPHKGRASGPAPRTPRSAALALLDKHQAHAQALSTTRAQLSAGSRTPRAADALKPTLEALRRAFAWLATQPSLGTVAQPAIRLCHPQALSGPDAAATLSQCEAALAAQRQAAEGWQAAWCATLLRDLGSLLPPQALPPTAAGTPAYPTAAMRTVLSDQVTPLLLALAEYAPLVREAGFRPQDYSKAAEVLPSCLQWTGLTDTQLRDLDARGPDLQYVALYQASMGVPKAGEVNTERLSRWSGAEAHRGRALLKGLLQAHAQGRLDAARREGAQAKLLLQDPGGVALMQAWEQCAPAPAALRGHTIEDTGTPGAVLAAVTAIRSCQSAALGSRNKGMLSRLNDGAKRMVVLRDAGGKPRARAMLRLMRTHDGRAVLMLSTLYLATGTRSEDAERAVHAHVRQRALALGVQAVCSKSKHTALPPTGFPLLSCESAPGDYWDEQQGFSTEPAKLTRTFRELAPAPSNRLQ